jgi:Ecdysteroid kinase-like family
MWAATHGMKGEFLKQSDLATRVVEDMAAQGIDGIGAGDLRPMDAASVEAVADNPEKYWISTTSSIRGGVLFISNDVNPDMMARAVDRAQTARNSLSSKVGSALLAPICSGSVDGRSYVLWSRERPFSHNRFRRYVQRRMTVPQVLEWIMGVAEETVRTMESRAVIDRMEVPLEAMAADTRFGPAVRENSQRALDRVRSGDWTPGSVLAHNDLWMDNVLLRSRNSLQSADSTPFVIIDWAGSKVEGYPFYDLTRFMMSAGLDGRTAGVYVHIYSQLVKCASEDAMGYVLASLGDLGRHLEQFPEERYVALVTQCHAFVEAATR